MTLSPRSPTPATRNAILQLENVTFCSNSYRYSKGRLETRNAQRPANKTPPPDPVYQEKKIPSLRIREKNIPGAYWVVAQALLFLAPPCKSRWNNSPREVVLDLGPAALRTCGPRRKMRENFTLGMGFGPRYRAGGTTRRWAFISIYLSVCLSVYLSIYLCVCVNFNYYDTTLRCTTLQYITLHCIALHCIALCCVVLRSITLHYATFSHTQLFIYIYIFTYKYISAGPSCSHQNRWD